MKTKKLALAALNSLLANMEPEELKFIPATEANAKEAIATLESDIAKPVDPYCWQVQGLRDTFKGEFAEMDAKSEAARIGGTAYAFSLYTTPQKPAAAAIPEGWKLVPIEPNDAMQAAGAQAVRFDTTVINKIWTGNAVYRAMLAAAPGGAA